MVRARTNRYAVRAGARRVSHSDLASAVAAARASALHGATVLLSDDGRCWWQLARTPAGEWRLRHDHSSTPLFDAPSSATPPAWARRALDLLARLDPEPAATHAPATDARNREDHTP